MEPTNFRRRQQHPGFTIQQSKHKETEGIAAPGTIQFFVKRGLLMLDTESSDLVTIGREQGISPQAAVATLLQKYGVPRDELHLVTVCVQHNSWFIVASTKGQHDLHYYLDKHGEPAPIRWMIPPAELAEGPPFGVEPAPCPHGNRYYCIDCANARINGNLDAVEADIDEAGRTLDMLRQKLQGGYDPGE